MKTTNARDMTNRNSSLLFSLYGNDVHPPHAVAWMKKRKSAFTLTSLGDDGREFKP